MAPNLFYGVGYNAEYGVRVFEDAKSREDLMTRTMPSASPANVMRDTETFFAHLDAQPPGRAPRPPPSRPPRPFKPYPSGRCPLLSVT